MEQQARDEAVAGPSALQRLLERERRTRGGLIVWIRVAGEAGEEYFADDLTLVAVSFRGRQGHLDQGEAAPG